MPRESRPLSRGQRGQTLAEFAIILVVLLLIILGIVDFSRAVFIKSVISNAAREGARYGIVHWGDDAGIEGVVRGRSTGFDTSRLAIGVTYPVTYTRHVQVEVSYVFHPVTPLIGQIIDGGSGAGILLRSRAVMRRE